MGRTKGHKKKFIARNKSGQFASSSTQQTESPQSVDVSDDTDQFEINSELTFRDEDGGLWHHERDDNDSMSADESNDEFDLESDRSSENGGDDDSNPLVSTATERRQLTKIAHSFEEDTRFEDMLARCSERRENYRDRTW